MTGVASIFAKLQTKTDGRAVFVLVLEQHYNYNATA